MSLSSSVPRELRSTTRHRPAAGVVLWGVLVAALVSLVAIEIIGGNDVFGTADSGGPGPLTPLYAAVGLAFGFVGALLTQRRPDVAVGWISWTAGALMGFGLAGAGYAGLSVADHAGSLPGTVAAAWAAAWMPQPALVLVIVLLPLLFPTGRPPSPRWRPVEVAIIGLIVAIVLGTMLRPGPLDAFPMIDNPTGISVPVIANVLAVANELTIVAVLVAGASAVARFRRAGPVERLQLRWFGSSVGLVVLTVLGAGVLPPPANDVSWTLVFVALSLVPVTIAVAILRYRLYDLDRLISRTVGWGFSTAVVLLLFVIALAALQTLLASLTQGATIAVAGSTLAALAAFAPLRRRTQAIVDRRFDRARYDGARTATAFADRLRGEVALDAVRSELVATIEGTLRPSSTAVWLRAGR